MSMGEPMVSGGAAFGTWLSRILPEAPARLLLVGLHTKTVVGALLAQGHEVILLPFSEQLVLAQPASTTRQAAYAVELPLPSPGTPCFDAVLVTGVSAQLHPLALFDQLCQCVRPGGIVVLEGQELQDAPPRVTRWLEYAVAIGTRCGFSPLAAEEIPPETRDGNFIRAFRKTATPRWQLRHLRADDYAEIAVLFEEVFGYPLSPKLWAWKYANGHGNAVLASRDGVLVAHYGGMYREIMLCGQPEWAYGGSDVMVHPKERGVMTRQGPFLLTAATTAELYGPVAFGFPTERAMLVAEKMGLYTKAGKMAEVRWTPSAPRPRLRTRVQPLTRENAEYKSLVAPLWDAMANDLRQAVVGVRDWKYLQHRYFDHPHNQYDPLVVTSRLTGKALGVMVLRRLEGSCELLDVIAPLANLPLVIDQARRMTARWSLPYLYCWITTNYASTFVACDGEEHALNVYIPTSCWTDDPRVEMLIDKWWLMSGDTDFR